MQRGESQPGVRVAWAARAARRWIDDLAANQILDTLIADKKALPMIVVMPNGRSSDEPVADPRVPRVEMQAHAAFEKELIADLIPFIESHYSAHRSRERVVQHEREAA